MPHTVNSAILEFGAADEVAQQSEGAQSRHHFVLNVLREQMGGSKPIAQIRRSDIDAVLAEMRRRGRAESTLNTYRATCDRSADGCSTTGTSSATPPLI